LTYEAGGRSQYDIFAFRDICRVLNVDRRYRIGSQVKVSEGTPVTRAEQWMMSVPGMTRYEERDDASGINIVVRLIDPVAMARTLYY
jgi:hypothetical protein